MPYKDKAKDRESKRRSVANDRERYRTYAREYARARKAGIPWVNPVPKPRVNRKGIPTGPRIDITGQRFNKLIAVRFVRMEPSPNGGLGTQCFWEFLCDCGTTKDINRCNVTAGKQRTCGECWGGKLIDPEYSTRRSLFCLYKKRCLRAGSEREFSLSEEQFISLTKSPCAICGALPATVYRQSHSGRDSYQCVYNGIDRIDNAVGYVEGNVRPCCIMCNKAKHAWPEEQFQEWLDRVVKFRTTLKEAVEPAGKN